MKAPKDSGLSTEPHATSHRHHLCGFDLNLTYPQNGTFPTLNLVPGLQQTLISASSSDQTSTLTSWKDAVVAEYAARTDPASVYIREEGVAGRLKRREAWKRDLSGRANGTIDPWYGCYIFNEMRDYALNFTFPWCK